MGMFIVVEVDRKRCVAGACRLCAEACPVDVFRLQDGLLVVDQENEDECTLCERCLQACPGDAIRLIKTYAA